MHVAQLLDYFQPGEVVLSPYGLAVVTTLFDEPFKKRPESEGNGEWPEGQDRPNYAAANIWVNGHGTETIELDRLVPATPETVAAQRVEQVLETHLERIEDSLEDLVKQNSLVHQLELGAERHDGKRRQRQL